MLIFALIGATWIFCSVMAISLCVMARRGDGQVVINYVSDAEDRASVDFIAGFEAQAPTAAPLPRPALRPRA
jgi:hypothetical protein